MNQQEKLRDFIEKRSYLVWYVADVARLSEESIVEHVLNYGTWEDVQGLISILGKEKVAEDFRKRSDMQRTNYRPEIKNFFQLYFNRYAA